MTAEKRSATEPGHPSEQFGSATVPGGGAIGEGLVSSLGLLLQKYLPPINAPGEGYSLFFSL